MEVWSQPSFVAPHSYILHPKREPMMPQTSHAVGSLAPVLHESFAQLGRPRTREVFP
jgi:hypothetical protein